MGKVWHVWVLLNPFSVSQVIQSVSQGSGVLPTRDARGSHFLLRGGAGKTKKISGKNLGAGRGSLKNFRGRGSHFSPDRGRVGAGRDVHPCSKALEPLGEPSLLVFGKKILGFRPNQGGGGGNLFGTKSQVVPKTRIERSPKGGCQINK